MPPASLVPPPLRPPRLGRPCALTGCTALALCDRYCDSCLADAAVAYVRIVEERLITHGYGPGTSELRTAVTNWPDFLDLTEVARVAEATELGWLRYAEARHLQRLIEQACLLVGLGGVAALSRLPGVVPPLPKPLPTPASVPAPEPAAVAVEAASPAELAAEPAAEPDSFDPGPERIQLGVVQMERGAGGLEFATLACLGLVLIVLAVLL